MLRLLGHIRHTGDERNAIGKRGERKRLLKLAVADSPTAQPAERRLQLIIGQLGHHAASLSTWDDAVETLTRSPVRLPCKRRNTADHLRGTPRKCCALSAPPSASHCRFIYCRVRFSRRWCRSGAFSVSANSPTPTASPPSARTPVRTS